MGKNPNVCLLYIFHLSALPEMYEVDGRQHRLVSCFTCWFDPDILSLSTRWKNVVWNKTVRQRWTFFFKLHMIHRLQIWIKTLCYCKNDHLPTYSLFVLFIVTLPKASCFELPNIERQRLPTKIHEWMNENVTEAEGAI